MDLLNPNDIIKEYICDFMSLTSHCIDYITEGYLHIYYEEEDYNITLHYCLRKSIRQLGYKIIEKKIYNNGVLFKTNIPENITDSLFTYYNENNYSTYTTEDIENDYSDYLTDQSNPESNDSNDNLDNPVDY